MLLQMVEFCSSYGWVIFHCVYIYTYIHHIKKPSGSISLGTGQRESISSPLTIPAVFPAFRSNALRVPQPASDLSSSITHLATLSFLILSSVSLSLKKVVVLPSSRLFWILNEIPYDTIVGRKVDAQQTGVAASSISQCMGAWLGRSRTLSWTELEFTLPQRLVYIDAFWHADPLTAGSSFFNYVDGPLGPSVSLLFKGGFGLFASKMFWFMVRLSEHNPPSLILKVFVGTSSAKSFSFPMILRRGNSPLSATNARETIS